MKTTQYLVIYPYVQCKLLARQRWSPYLFLALGRFLKKDKLMRATLLKEGNCACALRRCTCGKKKHITQTFFGIKEYHDLWFQFRFIPPTNFSLCECKDLQPHRTVAPPAVNTWLCKRMGRVFLFITLAALVTMPLMLKYSFFRTYLCVSFDVLSEEHAVLWSLTKRLHHWQIWFWLLILNH